MEIDGYNFVRTCSACPEQYEVYNKYGDHVCYVRLRYGNLTAEYPDVGGTEIYQDDIGDGWTGSFESEGQRMFHLKMIASYLDRIHNEN
jgi:hypothetical protein